MKKFCFRFTIILCCFFCYSYLSAEEKLPLIYKIDLKKEIGSTTWRYVRCGMNEAQQLEASAILVHMNTYGGTVVHADSIRTVFLNSSMPVYAFIDNNAASAGALIAIACDSIYMRPGANIGAVTVVNETGSAMPDKYQSYMRSTIRATAEAHGKDTVITSGGDTVIKWRRDPLIAEAMVDERIVVPHLSDSGKVLTLTAEEALQYGFSEGMAGSVDEIIKDKLGYKQYELKEYHPSVYDEIVGFLLNPALQAILVMIIIGGIYFELQTPGIGFPSAAALIAAVLYFAPLYLDGLAANWEILLFVAGVILLILEVFVIPGFGIAGISGIVLMIGALVLALLGNVNFNFDYVESGDINRSILIVVIGLILGTAIMIYLSHKIGHKGLFNRLALHATQDIEEGFIGVPSGLDEKVGATGIASTILRPSGKIRIGDVDYDAVALYGYIEKGTPVRVIKTGNGQLYVLPLDKK